MQEQTSHQLENVLLLEECVSTMLIYDPDFNVACVLNLNSTLKASHSYQAIKTCCMASLFYRRCFAKIKPHFH